MISFGFPNSAVGSIVTPNFCIVELFTKEHLQGGS